MAGNLILNIGLSRGDGFTVPPMEVFKALKVHGFLVDAWNFHDSDTEPTLVARVDSRDGATVTQANLEYLARDLGQECIAVYWPAGGSGALIGPKPWGEFNPALFINLDGTRLAQEVAA